MVALRVVVSVTTNSYLCIAVTSVLNAWDGRSNIVYDYAPCGAPIKTKRNGHIVSVWCKCPTVTGSRLVLTFSSEAWVWYYRRLCLRHWTDTAFVSSGELASLTIASVVPGLGTWANWLENSGISNRSSCCTTFSVSFPMWNRSIGWKSFKWRVVLDSCDRNNFSSFPH